MKTLQRIALLALISILTVTCSLDAGALLYAPETGAAEHPRRLTAAEHEPPAAIYHLNVRYYDPHAGRFISRDPLGDGLNWYAYARNNPLAFIDPSGLRPLSALEAEALDSVFQGTVTADEFELTMDETIGGRGVFNGLDENGKFDIRIRPDVYADLTGDSTRGNTNERSVGVVSALGIFIHEATHAWQHKYKLYQGKSPRRPIPPPPDTDFYGFDTSELTDLALGKEQHASAVQSYFHASWQLATGATIVDMTMDYRAYDVPKRFSRYSAPEILQDFNPLMNQLRNPNPIMNRPWGGVKAGIR